MAFRAGTVAVVGVPNVGKSTLVNTLVGQKVGIVTPLPQTTRRSLMGILNRPDYQIAFVDTPGIAEPRHRLGDALVRSARDSLSMCDVVLFVVDGSHQPGPGDKHVAHLISGTERPVVLCLNKIDKLKAQYVEENSEAFWALVPGAPWMMTAATSGENLQKLLELVVPLLPEGPALYPEDQYTNATERFQAEEFIREQVMLDTFEEVPHSVAVLVDRWEERENGVIYVAATIYVERQGQKGILVGKGGGMLKKIGEDARKEIEAMLGTRVFLELWVKVKEDWRKNPGVLRELGIE